MNKLLDVDVNGIKEFINKKGIKQKMISHESGISEVALCLVLKGKRKCEAGEYISLCKTLEVQPEKFLKPRIPSETK